MDQRPFPAYKGDEPYVFVSYAHADSVEVYPLLIALNDRGVNIWYDEGIEPGSKWREELSTAIELAEKVLFIASKKSVASPNCERELDYALSLSVPVRVVYIEEVQLPSALSFSLGSHQAIFSSHYDEETFQQKVYDVISNEPETLLGRITATRKKRNTLGLAALAIILLAGAGLVFFAAQSGPAVELVDKPPIDIIPSIEEPVRIAIKPLQNVTGDEGLEWVGEGLANLLRDQLSSSRYAVVLSPVSWLNLVDGAQSDAELIAASKKAGIDYLVSGDLLGGEDDLLATIRVTNLRAGIDVMSQTYRDLTTEELVNSSTRVALSVKQAMKIPRESGLQSLSADFVTKNIGAYEAYVDGLQHYNKFEYEEAEKSMNTALALAPDFHIARYRLADILKTKSQGAQANEEIAKIPTDAALDQREQLYIDGFRKALAGESETAIEVYQKILTDFPYEIEAQQLLARAYYDTYQEQKAIEVLKGLRQQEPENPHVLGALGYQLTSIGELEEATGVLKTYTDIAPDVPNSWELTGSLNLRTGELAAALQNFTKALAIDPDFTAAKTGLAKAQALEGKLGSAAAGFKSIRADETLPPRHRIDAAFNLAHILRAQEKPEEIEAALSSVVDLIRDEAVRVGLYWYVLAEAKADIGDREGAIADLQTGMREDQEGGVPTRFLHLLGVLKAQEGEPIAGELASLAEYRLPEDNPDRTEDKAIFHLQGLQALQAADATKAVNDLKQAVDLYGYEYGIYEIEQARALFASGKRKDAVALIEAARSKNDSLLSGELRLDLLWHQHRAAHVLAEFYTAMGQPQKAEKLLTTVHKSS